MKRSIFCFSGYVCAAFAGLIVLPGWTAPVDLEQAEMAAQAWAVRGEALGAPMGDGTTKGSASGYTVTRRYSGLLSVSGIGVTFADGMTLDLSRNTAPYVLPDNVAIGKGAKILIDVGDRVLQPGDQLLSCDARRIAEVGFVAPNGFHIVRKADGLYVYSMPMVFIL